MKTRFEADVGAGVGAAMTVSTPYGTATDVHHDVVDRVVAVEVVVEEQVAGLEVASSGTWTRSGHWDSVVRGI